MWVGRDECKMCYNVFHLGLYLQPNSSPTLFIKNSILFKNATGDGHVYAQKIYKQLSNCPFFRSFKYTTLKNVSLLYFSLPCCDGPESDSVTFLAHLLSSPPVLKCKQQHGCRKEQTVLSWSDVMPKLSSHFWIIKYCVCFTKQNGGSRCFFQSERCPLLFAYASNPRGNITSKLGECWVEHPQKRLLNHGW